MNPETPPIRVLVCDDHPMMREGIAAVIASQPDMCLAGEAGDGREAVAQYRALQPDVALIDIQMPDMNGIEAIQAIRAEFAQARIAVLTTYRGDARALQAIRSGAQAYLLKSALRKELFEHCQTLPVVAVCVGPQLVLDLVAFKIGQATHFFIQIVGRELTNELSVYPL